MSFVFTESVNTALNADRDLYQAHTAILNTMMAKQLGISATASLARYKENAQQAKDRMAKVLSLTSNYPEIAHQAENFTADFNAWTTFNDSILKTIQSGDVEGAARNYQTKGMALFETLRGNYDRVGEAIKTQSDEMTNASLASNSQQTFYMTIAIALTLIAVIASSIIAPRLVTQRIRILRNMLDSISQGEGDLTKRLDTSGKDEITQVAISFNALMDNLQRLISEIKSEAHSLGSAEQAMIRSSEEVSSLASNQREDLEQIATAITELNHALREVADNSQTALAETQSANQDCGASNTAVENSTLSIKSMSESITYASDVIQKLAKETETISSLLNVIREIADQTNLLALNAAIEAARAGEQGRGFAVDADEVRTLASRTQPATTDINDMLLSLNNGVTEAVNAIEGGSAQMGEVVSISEDLSERLHKVVQSVTGANDRIYQIATATEEQSLVVENLSENIASLNSLSQQVVKTAQNSRDAGHHVSEVCGSLENNIGRFKV